MSLVLGLEEVDQSFLSLVGGKNASLGEMIKSGIRVPPGFAVTTQSYSHFLDSTGIKERIYKLLNSMDPGDIAVVNAVSEEIRYLMEETPIPEEIVKAIEGHYIRLGEMCGAHDVPVAVRSSATAEDLPTASFAGQQDTYLWITGKEKVVEKVRKCWSSLFTPRAIVYRVKQGFSHEKVLLSVGVQKMVDAKAAGVMFTLNPLNGDMSKVVIEGSWGLGETVVSGTVTPDKFVVDKVMMEVNERVVSIKHVQCVFDPEAEAAMETEVPLHLQGMCCLEEEEIIELVQLAKHIEGHYKRPMDIEWSIDKTITFPNNVFIVQARPETVWSQKVAQSKIGMKSGYDLLMEQAMKRIRLA